MTKQEITDGLQLERQSNGNALAEDTNIYIYMYIYIYTYIHIHMYVCMYKCQNVHKKKPRRLFLQELYFFGFFQNFKDSIK